MKLRRLCLSDRAFFERAFQKSPGRLSAYAFASLFIWREFYDIRWALVRGSVCCFFRDSSTCFMPLPPLGRFDERVIGACFALMEETNHNRDISRIENVEENALGAFAPARFRHYKKCDEYLFLRREMTALRGERYKHKRNLCNHFLKHAAPAFRCYRAGDRAAVLRLHTLWTRERAARRAEPLYRSMLEDSRRVLETMLASMKRVGGVALVCEAQGRIRGFTSGFFLADGSFCVNFEFADLAFKGISAALFREFGRRLDGVEWINAMDDSGLDNIRRAKEIYRPQKMLPAYTVLVNDEPGCC